MFKTSNPSGFAEILEGVHHGMAAEEDMEVGGDFQVEEVYQALKQMAPLMAL